MDTVREVIQAELDDLSVDVSTTTLDRALLDADMIGTDSYTKAKSETVDRLLYVLLLKLLAMPNITDAGTSISWDRNAVSRYVAHLASKWPWGTTVVPTPTVTDRSNIW